MCARFEGTGFDFSIGLPRKRALLYPFRSQPSECRSVTTDAQLPGPGQVFLDHVGWFVADISAAQRAFERLGFVLTPYAEHSNATAEGDRVPSGTANRCAMLQQGYLEFLAQVPGSETALSRQLRAGLMRYEGVHLIALATSDAEAERVRLAAAGFDPQPVVKLRRPLALVGGGEAMASFSVLRTPPQRMPEGRIQFLAHETPERVWQPGLLAPVNGIEALTGVLLVVADVAEAAERYARFCGRKARSIDGGGAVVALDRGQIAMIGRDTSSTLSGTALPSPPPRMAAIALRSGNLETTKGLLQRQGIRPASMAADHMVLHANDAVGAELIIHAEGAEDRLYAR